MGHGVGWVLLMEHRLQLVPDLGPRPSALWGCGTLHCWGEVGCSQLYVPFFVLWGCGSEGEGACPESPQTRSCRTLGGLGHELSACSVLPPASLTGHLRGKADTQPVPCPSEVSGSRGSGWGLSAFDGSMEPLKGPSSVTGHRL